MHPICLSLLLFLFTTFGENLQNECEQCKKDGKDDCPCGAKFVREVLTEEEKEKLKSQDITQTGYKETTFEHDENFKIYNEVYPENKLIELDGGEFRMGTNAAPYPEDGEGPARSVTVDPFAIDMFEVSNGEFREFVLATDYITEAEKFGNSFVMDIFLSKEVNESITQAVVAAKWWLPVPGASWKHPEGKGSSIKNRLNHPVLHVSWNDASSFCHWKGKRLPTEAEWEFACRGGKKNRLYPWGNKFKPRDEFQANIWQGKFPTENAAEDGYNATCPVDMFKQNPYGVHNMVGNVWEWVSDWWTNRHTKKSSKNPTGPPAGGEKTKKGGSFMCSKEFCYRYRCSARRSISADSSAYNVGFRCAKTVRKSGETRKEKEEL